MAIPRPYLVDSMDPLICGYLSARLADQGRSDTHGMLSPVYLHSLQSQYFM